MQPGLSTISAVRGNITTFAADVIVNAANAALCGGGGVDGAIHRAAGPALLAECRTLGAARPGEVKLTAAYQLPAKFIAHAVGPVWRGGDAHEDGTLASCYSNAIHLAHGVQATSIAFPSISTGAYKFPLERAARIAVQAVTDALAGIEPPMQVTFVLFSDRDEACYRAAIDAASTGIAHP